jgi:hypothetical protein
MGISAETVRIKRDMLGDLADRLVRLSESGIEVVEGHDTGPYRVHGMTVDERLNAGLLEIVEVRIGRGRKSRKGVRSKYTHPLDKYLAQEWLGDIEAEGKWRFDAGMMIHHHFKVALADPRVTASYTPAGSGGREEWGVLRLDARTHLNAAMLALNSMSQRIVLSICCLAEGLSDFDEEMIETGRIWRPRVARIRLVEALDDLRRHYQRHPPPKHLLP